MDAPTMTSKEVLKAQRAKRDAKKVMDLADEYVPPPVKRVQNRKTTKQIIEETLAPSSNEDDEDEDDERELIARYMKEHFQNKKKKRTHKINTTIPDTEGVEARLMRMAIFGD